MIVDSAASRLASQGVAYAPQIAGAARRHGLDPDLLAAVAAQETGGPGSNAGHNVVGDGGHGRGLFQIDDRWHPFAETPAAMDPGENADYAAGMLSGLLSRYGGNVRRALSAYNAGNPDATGTRTQWPDGRTLGYADSVMQHYSELTGTPAGPSELAAGQVAAGGEPPHDTGVSEIATLLAELSAMQAQAQAPPPSAPPSPQPQSYQPQVTDYGSLLAVLDDN